MLLFRKCDAIDVVILLLYVHNSLKSILLLLKFITSVVKMVTERIKLELLSYGIPYWVNGFLLLLLQ